MADTPSFKTLKDQYFLLDRKFNVLFAACTTNAERDQLRRDYVNARDNFWEARNRIFIENDPLVKQMNTELRGAKVQIDNMLQNLQNIVQILDVITAAVRLGSSLVTLGSGIA